MLDNEIKDFVYHEFKTDGDNFVKDISKVFALGCYSKKVVDKDGNITKPSTASIEYNWKIVHPSPNFDLIDREVSNFDELDSYEYETIVTDQISRIDNRVTVKCMTLSENKDSVLKALSNKTSQIGESQKDTAEMFLQIYMPKYLCDTELVDPFVQEDGVNIPLNLNVRNNRKDAKIRNYHWCLMRVFDNPNEDFSGPKDNKTDLVTGEILEFNSASSEWAKLSWFTDYEEVFENSKLVRIPISSSLTNKTKIRVMINMHPNRAAISVVGNPNVDYSDNRYLISSAYIGAIDSFKDAKKDIEGNFSIFTSSCSVPSIPAEAKESTPTFSGLNKDELGVELPTAEKWKVYDQKPPKVELINPPDQYLSAYINLGTLQDLNVGSVGEDGVMPGEMTFISTYKKREISADEPSDSEGGRTEIVGNSIRAIVGYVDQNFLSFNGIYQYGNGYYDQKSIPFSIPVSDLKSSLSPCKVTFESKEGSLSEKITVTIKNEELFKYVYKYIEAELATSGDLSALIPRAYKTQIIRFSGRTQNGESFSNINPHSCHVGFDEQGIIRKVVNKSKRDKYGNLISVDYPKTFGINTANCTTDFAMYKSDSSDFWQSHYFMFSSSEQFMKKHMYGKSAYTNEYFADRIKITHSAEGVRGILSGLIVIDADSLFAFDELIVNKEFNKDKNKPEETYVYLPITANYCPFSNSPNERVGIGLLKDVKYSEHDDESKCDAALNELSKQYIDSLFYTNNKENIELADQSHNGLQVAWATDAPSIVEIPTAGQTTE